LEFRAWQPGEPLTAARFGVMEPAANQPLATPEVLLVPLLAFDRTRHRLGWGKGYYYRTLAALRAGEPRVLAIGVAFAAQEVDRVPVGPGDQRLDAVVTELGVYAAGRR